MKSHTKLPESQRKLQDGPGKPAAWLDSWVPNIAPYQYEPLQGQNKIRVVELLPRTGQYRGLACTIRQIDYSESGYQALSYVWGSEDRPWRLKVLNEMGMAKGYISLTVNLKNALHDLQDATGLEKKVFWIDQICIDQNGTEKNGQVALMGMIYENAARVITYLGPAIQDEKLEQEGIDKVKQLNYHLASVRDEIIKADYLVDVFWSRKRLPLPKLPPDVSQVSDELWSWMAALAFGSWSMRMWMVQEQVLNRDVVMLRGPQVLSWDSIAVLSSLYYLQILPRNPFVDFWVTQHPERTDLPEAFAHSVWTLWKARHVRYSLPSQPAPIENVLGDIEKHELPCKPNGVVDSQDQQLLLKLPNDLENPRGPQEMKTPWLCSLLHNMINCEDLDCRDARDRVYAVLAVSLDTTPLFIVPDYQESNTVQRLYLRLSISLLKQYDPIYILACACRWDNTDPCRPSWALYLPRPKDQRAIWTLDSTPGALPPRRLEALPRFILNHTVLILRGRIVDHITFVSPPIRRSLSYTRDLQNESFMQDLLTEIAAYLKIFERIELSIQKVHDMVLVVLAEWDFAEYRKTQKVNEDAVYSFWCFLRTMLQRIRRMCMTCEMSTRTRSNTNDFLKKSEHWIHKIAALVLSQDDLTSFSIYATLSLSDQAKSDTIWDRRQIQGRSLGMTAQGRICNGMHEVKEKDVVVAFRGTESMFILRPCGSRYRLIGDAWVEGIMDEQVFEGADIDEITYDVEIV